SHGKSSRSGLLLGVVRGRFGRSDADTHSVQMAAGLLRFGRLRVALDEVAEVADSGVALIGFQFGLAFAKLRGGRFGAAGELLEDGVIALDRGGKVSFTEGDFAEIVLRVGSEVVLRIGLQELLEFSRSEIVARAVVIGERALIELVGGRSLRLRGGLRLSGLSGLRWRAGLSGLAGLRLSGLLLNVLELRLDG